MKQPVSKLEQLKSLRKRQVYTKWKVGVINRELNRLLRLSQDRSEGLTHHAALGVVRLVSKLGKLQREVITNRETIAVLEANTIRGSQPRRVTFEGWCAILYDIAAMRGCEEVLASDREEYRPAYDQGRKTIDVIDEELSSFKNLIINGRKVT